MEIEEGRGWRLVLNPSRQPFAVLVGSDCWAAELTLIEARALRRGLIRLIEQHHALATQLMAEEAITLELDMELTADGDRNPEGGRSCSGPPLAACGLWLGLEGDRNDWELRFVLTPDASRRAIEGCWPAPAGQAFAAALARIDGLAD